MSARALPAEMQVRRAEIAEEMHALRYRAELLEVRCNMRLAGQRTGLRLPRQDDPEVWDEGSWETDVLELAQILGKMCHLVSDALEPLATGKCWQVTVGPGRGITKGLRLALPEPGDKPPGVPADELGHRRSR